MVFEILGCNLLSIVRLYKSKGLPVPLVKMITKQILTALDFLHSDCSIIHTDLKPENVLMRCNPDLSSLQNAINSKLASIVEVEAQKGTLPALSSSSAAIKPASTLASTASSASTTSTASNASSSAKIETTVSDALPAASSAPSSTSSLTSDSVIALGSSTSTESTVTSTVSQNSGEYSKTPSGVSDSHSVSSLSTSTEMGSPALSIGTAASSTTPLSTSKTEHEKSTTTEPSDPTNKSIDPAIRKFYRDDVRDDVDLPTDKQGLLSVFGNGAFKCKIADLGNACFTYRHFTDDVQTRHYRAPEVIVGYQTYDTPIDMWSLACLVFELLTGDLLFEPHAGKNYTKDDDHLAQIMELLGKMPRELVTQGKHSTDFMTRNGELRYIKNLRFWALKDVLLEKYRHSPEEASTIASFLLPMLEYMPNKRATARDRLRHPWIRDVDVNAFESCFEDNSA